MSINSRQKGKRIEREAAKKLEEILGCSARRTQQYSGTEGTSDVTTDIYGLHIEVKGNERLTPWSALEQAEEDRNGIDTPLAVMKRNGKPFIVCLFLDDLKTLYHKLDYYYRQKALNDGEIEVPAE